MKSPIIGFGSSAATQGRNSRRSMIDEPVGLIQAKQPSEYPEIHVRLSRQSSNWTAVQGLRRQVGFEGGTDGFETEQSEA
jgi:hypothetical protein